jgi:hypothetical protein
MTIAILSTDDIGAGVDHRPQNVRAMQESLIEDVESLTGQHARQYHDVFGLPAPKLPNKRPRRPKTE